MESKIMERNRKNRMIRIALLLILAVCLIGIGREYHALRRQKAQQKTLRQETVREEEPSETASSQMDEAADASTQEVLSEEEEEEPVILAQYADLYAQNNDLTGWLSIEGTVMDYPVMQNADDEYYLHHDFYGNESKYGCLYVRGKADLADGTNVIIYGHNMKDGSMFGDLDLYQSADFCRGHSIISFDTLYEERMYEIVAVFRSQVYDVDEDVFKYYQFYEAHTQEEFDDFYQNIKELSLYDTGVTAQFGDTFLTLSTCAYHVTDGRFVVVAKRCVGDS